MEWSYLGDYIFLQYREIGKSASHSPYSLPGSQSHHLSAHSLWMLVDSVYKHLMASRECSASDQLLLAQLGVLTRWKI